MSAHTSSATIGPMRAEGRRADERAGWPARIAALAAGACTVLACTSASSAPDAARGDGEVPAVLEIGTYTNGDTFSPWHDGDTIAQVWGPQGGVMITPGVALDGAWVTGAYPTLVASLENLVLPSLTPLAEFPTYGPTTSVFARVGPRVIGGPIYDQLGWTPVTGPLRVRAHVTGPGVDLFGVVDIVLASP